MKLNAKKLASLKSLSPEAVKGHIDILKEQRGRPGFGGLVVARTAGVATAVITEAFLAFICAPFIPEIVGGIGELIAPFVAGKAGFWVNRKLQEKFSRPVRPFPAQTPPPLPRRLGPGN